MQKEIGVPNSKITIGYLTESIKIEPESNYTRTTTEVYDFVKNRTFTIDSLDLPPVSSEQYHNNNACFAHIVDPEKEYYVYVSQYNLEQNQNMYDSLSISITDIKNQSNIRATYNSNGELSSFRSHYDFDHNAYGRLSWSEKFKPVISIDFVETPRYFISETISTRPGEEFKLITNILDSKTIKMTDFTGKPRRYLASIPTQSLTNQQAPVYMELSDDNVTLTIESPEQVSKIAKLPRKLHMFDLYGLRHAEPKSFVDLPFNEFSINVLDYTEPVS